MDIRKLFGANVRRIRIDIGMTQAAVSAQLGLDRAYISSIERGLQNVTLISLLEVAQALGVRPVDLLQEDVPANPEA